MQANIVYGSNRLPIAIFFNYYYWNILLVIYMMKACSGKTLHFILKGRLSSPVGPYARLLGAT